jgi:hypothetical protein
VWCSGSGVFLWIQVTIMTGSHAEIDQGHAD